MKFTLRGVCAVLGLMLASVAVPVWAHHATQAEFDFNKKFDLTGTVVKMEWINPHAYLYADIKDGDKTVRWAFEFVGPAGLARVGLRKSDGGLQAGDPISMTGYKAKDGSNLGFIESLTLKNGRKVTTWNNDPNAR
jgi:hypothetical protein